MPYSHRLSSAAVLVAVLFIIFSAYEASAKTDSGDAAAMHDIAKSLTGTASLGWSPSVDPCSWPGVSCSTDGKVTAIQVGNKSLSGELSPAVANLSSLTRLELQSNFISGDLPSLAGLSSLQFLLLHSNHFASIPPTFFQNLSALQAVYIDNNPLKPWSLSASAGDLSAAAGLVNFSAVNTNITGQIPASFATAFASLDHLALSYNPITGGIPKEFAGSGLRSLWLNNAQLSGEITVIANMTSLTELWLNVNGFTGPIPDLSALQDLQDLQLRDNQLTGVIPESLVNRLSLRKVTLSNNLLQGAPPVFPKSVDVDLVVDSERFCVSDPGAKCDPRVNTLLTAAGGFGYPAKLADSWIGNNPCTGDWVGISCDVSGNISIVNLQKMGLNGSISPAFADLPALQRLLLSGNNLTGTIPEELVGIVSLKEIDVSDNHLYGKIPQFGKNVLVKKEGNPDLGKDNPSTPTGSNPSPSPSISNSSGAGFEEDPGKRGSKSRNHAGVIAGSVIGGCGAVLIVGLFGFCFYKKKQKRFRQVQSPNTTIIHPRHSGSDPDMVKITVASSSANANGAASDTYSRTSSSGRRAGDIHMVEAGNMVISIQVLRNVTNNFSEENVLGRGGFGTVYKGELHDGTKIAVKRMEAAGAMGTKGLTEFKSEIAVLTKVRHRNLVSLLGYCLDGNERLLVYEYMPQGPLSKHLFGWKEENLKPLDWKKRLSIALDVARGVEYLHSLAHQSFIHRDLKPSNILLGDDMKAKVADFGLVRLAPDGKCCSVETRLAGTFGYLAPEYAVTGRVTTKADVFSFGVILMELITGRKALDESQPEESVHLVTWFRRMQLNKDTFRKAVDHAIHIDNEETLASISTVAELAGHCCAREPHQRPDMGHAVNVLSSLAEMWRPADPDSEDSYGIDLDMTLPQALKKWQAFEDSQMDGATSSFLASLDNTQTSIPTRPPGFAESFTSADGR